MGKYNFLIFNILKRKKLCKLSISVFLVVFITLISILGLRNGLSNQYNKLKEKYIVSTYVVITTDNNYHTITDFIKDYHYIKQYYPYLKLEKDNNTFLYYDDNLVKINKGRKIKKENEVIVSSNSEFQIGDYLDLRTNKKEYNLKIVGKYDEGTFFNADNYDTNSSLPILCSFSLMNKIVNKNNIDKVIVQIKDYSYLNSFLSELEKNENFQMHIDPTYNDILDKNNKIILNIDFFINVIVIFLLLFIEVVDLIIIYDNRVNFAILKSVGFSSAKISVLTLLYSILLLFISFFFSIPILSIIILLFNKFFAFNFSLLMKILVYFITIFTINGLILYFVIRRINIIKLLKT